MAHKKSGGSTNNGRDSISKRLGLKLADGQMAFPGNIIVRQRGTKFRKGKNVKRGNDDTLYAIKSGVVSIKTRYTRRHYSNQKKMAKYIHVIPAAEKKTTKAAA